MKGRNMMIFMMVIVLVGAVAAIVFWTYKAKKPVVSDDVYLCEETERPDESDMPREDAVSEDAIQVYKDAKYLTVEKVARTIVENADGSFTTSYDTYLVSDVYLENNSDQTDDYKNAVLENGFYEDGIEVVTFKDAFGFSYVGMDGWSIYERLLSENGFNGSMEEATYDSDTNALTGQNLWVFKNCDALKKLSNGITDIKESKAYVQMSENADGVKLPEFYSAEVKYVDGDQTITKSIYIQVSVNNWDLGEEG